MSPAVNGDLSTDVIKLAPESYTEEIIDGPPVVPQAVPVKEEKKEKPYEFEGIIYNTGCLK